MTALQCKYSSFLRCGSISSRLNTIRSGLNVKSEHFWDKSDVLSISAASELAECGPLCVANNKTSGDFRTEWCQKFAKRRTFPSGLPSWNLQLTKSIISQTHYREFTTSVNNAKTFEHGNKTADISNGSSNSLATEQAEYSLEETTSQSELTFVEKVKFSDDDVFEVEEEHEIDILQQTENPEIIEEYATVPLMPESFTLASYVEQSETLQKLVQMGVDLSKLERRRGVASMLLKMDFENDIKDKLAYLHHVGVPGEKLGAFVTRNPFVLGEEIQILEARVDYLLQKDFSQDAIEQIINRAPYFLNFSIERVDSKLGYYQQLLGLNDDHIRDVITRCPKLVTMKVSRPKENLFVLEFQCGFSKSALRNMVLKEPAILLRGKFRLIAMFDYLHNVMKIPHSLLLQTPQVFHGHLQRVKDRHKYLSYLKRNRYNPTEPGYVPLTMLIKLPDAAFCQDIAKTSPEDYEQFLKTCT